MSTKREKLITLCECAILIALSTVLSMFKVWEAPFGGSVTILSMLPVMLISMRHGLGWGFGSCFVFSVIQLVLGINSISYIPTTAGVICSILFDYIVPFTALGIAGIFMKKNFKSKKGEYIAIVSGMGLAVLIRFLCHFFVGALLWYELTKAGQWNDYVNQYGMWTYSFLYQITYLGPETLILLVASPVVPKLYEMRLTK